MDRFSALGWKPVFRSAGRRPAIVAGLLALGVLAVPFFQSAEGASKKKKHRTPEPTAVPRPPDPYRVTLQTPDGVLLAASWRPVPDESKAPAVILVHDFSRDRREWGTMSAECAARGMATLAIDLRGHGDSTKKLGTSAPVHLSPRLLTDSSGFPRDVETASRWLRQRTERVGVLGLSLGANLAVLATASAWADAGVAISANSDRLLPLAGPLPHAPRATLVMASENDPGRARSARFLDASGRDPKSLLLFPGTAHGMALLTTRPEALKAALDWLAERLGHGRPAPVPAEGAGSGR